MKTYSGRYAYDEAGQLVREDNRRAGKTYVYVYDIGGNIVSKTEYDYTEDDITAEMTPTDTKTFGYSHGTWNDVLTSYNGVPVAYDAMGNITSFGGDTYEWTAGRQLKKLTEQDGDFFLYYYNESGFLLRYEAYAADGTYNGSMSYYWDGDRLLGCKVVNAPTEDSTGSEIPVRIMYDSDGEAVGFLLADSAPVYYGKNLQGDITALYDHEGTYIVGYIYDAYGNIVNFDIPTDESLSTGEQIGKMVVAFFYASFNPLSYRGYLYAPAIGLSYYLGSRFYCPAICRFLNADVYADTGTGAAGTNMFAYCNNNPVMYVDPDGETPSVLTAITSSVIVTLLTAVTAFCLGLLISSIANELQRIISVFATDRIGMAIKTNYWLTKHSTKGVLNTIKVLETAWATTFASIVLDTVKSMKNKKNSEAKHHIVAKNDKRAKISRDILLDSGLSLDGNYNTVYLYKCFHSVLHTSAYHYNVRLLMIGADDLANHYRDVSLKESVFATLYLMKTILAVVNNLVGGII